MGTKNAPLILQLSPGAADAPRVRQLDWGRATAFTTSMNAVRVEIEVEVKYILVVWG